MSQAANPHFQLATVSAAGGARFGAIVVDGKAVALQALPQLEQRATSVLGVLEAWDSAFDQLRRAADVIRSDLNGQDQKGLGALALPLEHLRLAPPVDLPRQVFCTGANYRGHVAGLIRGDPAMRSPGSENENPEALAKRVEAEMEARAKEAKPYCFAKLPTAIIGPNDPLVLPKHVQKPDWELELAVIIGKRARYVSEKDAMAHVAGYAILNDITARELIFRRDGGALGADWLAGKCQPGFAPFGPFITPAAFIKDVYDLKIQLSVNGKMYQDECTSDMLISIARQIEWLSSIVELMPGDVISTGSPAGNGSMHGVFLKPGDLMEGRITSLGRQRTQCVAEG